MTQKTQKTQRISAPGCEGLTRSSIGRGLHPITAVCYDILPGRLVVVIQQPLVYSTIHVLTTGCWLVYLYEKYSCPAAHAGFRIWGRLTEESPQSLESLHLVLGLLPVLLRRLSSSSECRVRSDHLTLSAVGLLFLETVVNLQP